MSIPFDMFTEQALHVLTLTQEEAQRLNHNYLGTEHLLLALVREDDGIAGRALRDLGVELRQVRERITFITGRGRSMIMGEIRLTPRAKTVLQFAVEEARGLEHQRIGTGHLLLGLVREGEGIAAGVLVSLGLDFEQVRDQVLGLMGSGLDDSSSTH